LNLPTFVAQNSKRNNQNSIKNVLTRKRRNQQKIHSLPLPSFPFESKADLKIESQSVMCNGTVVSVAGDGGFSNVMLGFVSSFVVAALTHSRLYCNLLVSFDI
jgi:hypothetical protein